MCLFSIDWHITTYWVHLLSPLCLKERKKIHMSIIIMITDVLMFGCEKEDRISPIGFLYLLKTWNTSYVMHWHLFLLVNVWSKRLTWMMSNNPLATITFFDQKTWARWHLSLLFAFEDQIKMCRSMWTSGKLLEILIENEKKWTSNYFWSGERISSSPTVTNDIPSLSRHKSNFQKPIQDFRCWWRSLINELYDQENGHREHIIW
jgi:hypothetical protein